MQRLSGNVSSFRAKFVPSPASLHRRGIHIDTPNGAGKRPGRLLKHIALAFLALLSPPIALLLAGVPARWAALPLLLPFAAVPVFWNAADHPHALALLGLLTGVGAVLITLTCAAVAFWYAGRASRQQRSTTRLLGILGVFVIASVVAHFLLAPIRESRLEPFRIPSGAMLPTLVPGDQFFVDKRKLTAPQPGDVVVFRPPRGGPEPHVKRVIAVAGDTIETAGDRVWVNGRELPHLPLGPNEACSEETSETARGRCIREDLRPGRSYELLLVDRTAEPFGPRTLEPGELFVLGDNRNNSYDSRHFGPIREDAVVGRAIVVWFSWWDWRLRLKRIGVRP
jgi:signal peptidase I